MENFLYLLAFQKYCSRILGIFCVLLKCTIFSCVRNEGPRSIPPQELRRRQREHHGGVNHGLGSTAGIARLPTGAMSLPARLSGHGSRRQSAQPTMGQTKTTAVRRAASGGHGQPGGHSVLLRGHPHSSQTHVQALSQVVLQQRSQMRGSQLANVAAASPPSRASRSLSFVRLRLRVGRFLAVTKEQPTSLVLLRRVSAVSVGRMRRCATLPTVFVFAALAVLSPVFCPRQRQSHRSARHLSSAAATPVSALPHADRYHPLGHDGVQAPAGSAKEHPAVVLRVLTTAHAHVKVSADAIHHEPGALFQLERGAL